MQVEPAVVLVDDQVFLVRQNHGLALPPAVGAGAVCVFIYTAVQTENEEQERENTTHVCHFNKILMPLQAKEARFCNKSHVSQRFILRDASAHKSKAFRKALWKKPPHLANVLDY